MLALSVASFALLVVVLLVSVSLLAVAMRAVFLANAASGYLLDLLKIARANRVDRAERERKRLADAEAYNKALAESHEKAKECHVTHFKPRVPAPEAAALRTAFDSRHSGPVVVLPDSLDFKFDPAYWPTIDTEPLDARPDTVSFPVYKPERGPLIALGDFGGEHAYATPPEAESLEF